MKPFTEYNSVAVQHQALTKAVTERVTRVAAVEQLFLLGLTTTQSSTKSLFAAPLDNRVEANHCFLLVLVAKEGTGKLSQLQDSLENVCAPLVATTVIVLYSEQFNDWLRDRHPFAHTVQRWGMQLYSHPSDKKEPNLLSLDAEALKREQERCYVKGMNKVQEFLAGAALYTVRKQYKMAALMLHQAAEHSLHTLLEVTTGLRVNTHNLDKLIRYGSMVSCKLQHHFPRGSDTEKRLFKLLQTAYTDARYKEDYSIHFQEVEQLTKQVTLLKEEVASLCKRTFIR